jgi:hypothetical protein
VKVGDAAPKRAKALPVRLPPCKKKTLPHAWRRQGSGAPIGNQNALTHGLYTAESKAFNKHIQEILRRGKENLGKV